jgi:UDP-N-acetylglucosamine 2-epimerase (non-hydrolysing)
MRLIVVVGARPNFIKVGPLMPALAEAGIEAHLVHTGQHYDAAMSDVFFADLDLPEPKWYLGVGSGTHAVQTGNAMIKLEELFAAERPDGVIVVGDVNSTLAGALAATKLHIPVIHLEAGLRSGDMSMPEEVNRLVTDQLSSMLLTPAEEAGENLVREGIDPSRIHFVGNIMAESVLRNLPRIKDRRHEVRKNLYKNEFVVATIHRPENTDNLESLQELTSALLACPLPVFMPVHPRTRPILAEAYLPNSIKPVTLMEPVGYLDMLALMKDAAAVVTDSGGVQEEACMLGTPCVTVRRNTERGVTVRIGANTLVPADSGDIYGGMADAIDGFRKWDPPERWDTEVSKRIVEALQSGVLPLAVMV